MGICRGPIGAGRAGACNHRVSDSDCRPRGDCNKLVTLNLDLRELSRDVVSGMEEHDLLTSASAIAFQVMTALIPIALLALSVMGFLQLGDVWTDELAPQAKYRCRRRSSRSSTTSRDAPSAPGRGGG